MRIERRRILKPLARSFYFPSAEQVARRLLGHWLVRNTSSGPCGGVIVETEAYLVDDPACHGAPGLTQRNRVLFGPPGHVYVYLIYGCHYCVNAVCCAAGIAEAVLIRAIEPVFGEEKMRHHRKVDEARDLTNGPGKLCQALKINRELDGVDLCSDRSQVFIARNPGAGALVKHYGPVIVGPRIGITRAASLPLRFYLDASGFVSRRTGGRQARKAPIAPRERRIEHMKFKRSV